MQGDLAEVNTNISPSLSSMRKVLYKFRAARGGLPFALRVYRNLLLVKKCYEQVPG